MGHANARYPIHMKNPQQYVTEYKEEANKARTLLQEVLASMEAGRGVSSQIRHDLSASLERLDEAFETVQRAALSKAPGASDTSIFAYASMLESGTDQSGNALKEFVAVTASTPPFAKALAPYQEKASRILDGKEPEDSSLTKAAEVFLQCVACPDLATAEGQKLLQELEIYMPVIRIHRGLSVHAYTAPAAPVTPEPEKDIRTEEPPEEPARTQGPPANAAPVGHEEEHTVPEKTTGKEQEKTATAADKHAPATKAPEHTLTATDKHGAAAKAPQQGAAHPSVERKVPADTHSDREHDTQAVDAAHVMQAIGAQEKDRKAASVKKGASAKKGKHRRLKQEYVPDLNAAMHVQTPSALITPQEAPPEIAPDTDEMIRATKLIKSSAPSGGGFKKDLLLLPHARLVLPMFSRFGAMTANQANVFSLLTYSYLYWTFEEDAGETLEKLVNKNLVACYPNVTAEGNDVFVATRHGLDLFTRKNMVKSGEILETGRGNIFLAARQEMPAHLLRRYTDRNDAIIRYLVASRASLTTSEFEGCLQAFVGRETEAEVGVLVGSDIEKATLVVAPGNMPRRGNVFLAYDPDSFTENAFITDDDEYPDLDDVAKLIDKLESDEFDKDEHMREAICCRPQTPPKELPEGGQVYCGIETYVYCWDEDHWAIPAEYATADEDDIDLDDWDEDEDDEYWDTQDVVFDNDAYANKLSPKALEMYTALLENSDENVEPDIPFDPDRRVTKVKTFERDVKNIRGANSFLPLFTMFGALIPENMLGLGLMTDALEAPPDMLSDMHKLVEQLEKKGILTSYVRDLVPGTLAKMMPDSDHLGGFFMLTPYGLDGVRKASSSLWTVEPGRVDMPAPVRMTYTECMHVFTDNLIFLMYMASLRTEDLDIKQILEACHDITYSDESRLFSVPIPWDDEMTQCVLCKTEEELEACDADAVIFDANTLLKGLGDIADMDDLNAYHPKDRGKYETFWMRGIYIYRWMKKKKEWELSGTVKAHVEEPHDSTEHLKVTVKTKKS